MAGERGTVAGERGTALLGSVFGIGILLSFLLVATHVLVHLYATSVVEGVAYDTARAVSGASSGDPAAARPSAEAAGRALLGSFADGAEFDWSESTAGEVVLRVRVDSPTLVPARLRGPLGLDSIERSVRMRVEQFR